MTIAIEGKSNQGQTNEDLINKVKQNWSVAEDAKLSELVHVYGPVHWPHIAKLMSQRTARQCRERWNIKLNPDVIKGNWTLQEDRTIVELYKSMGSQWTEMAKSLTCRVENDIRNRFYAIKRSCNRNGYETVESAYDDGYFEKSQNVQKNCEKNLETKKKSSGEQLSLISGSTSVETLASDNLTFTESTSINGKKKRKSSERSIESSSNALSFKPKDCSGLKKQHLNLHEAEIQLEMQNNVPVGSNYLFSCFANMCGPFSGLAASQQGYLQPGFQMYMASMPMNYSFMPASANENAFLHNGFSSFGVDSSQLYSDLALRKAVLSHATSDGASPSSFYPINSCYEHIEQYSDN